MTSRPIVNVQALRAIAALLVALGHGSTHVGAFPDWFARPLSLCAYAGVDIFFVISGFIVSRAAARAGMRALAEGRVSVALDFAMRRAFRIFPLYWLALGIAIFLQNDIHIAAPWPHRPLAAMALLQTMWVAPLPSAWSLAFEIYFYSALTLLLFVAGRYIQIAMTIWLIAQVVWIVAPATSIHSFGLGADPLVLEFGLGWLVARLPLTAMGASLAALFAALFWGAGMWMTAHHGLLGAVDRVETFGVASGLLLHAVLWLETVGWRAPRWIQRLGDASYSIYLWHMIVFGVVFSYSPLDARATLALGFALLLSISFISYATVEIPSQKATRWIRSWLRTMQSRLRQA